MGCKIRSAGDKNKVIILEDKRDQQIKNRLGNVHGASNCSWLGAKVGSQKRPKG